MGDRLGIPRALSVFIFFYSEIWNQHRRLRLQRNLHQNRKKIFFVSFGRNRVGRVYLASRARTFQFTHPIFESDFDCLTGKNRLHAQLSLIPTWL